jgi:hypothetical protein
MVFSDLWNIFLEYSRVCPHLDGRSSRKQHQYRRIVARFFFYFNPKNTTPSISNDKIFLLFRYIAFIIYLDIVYI